MYLGLAIFFSFLSIPVLIVLRKYGFDSWDENSPVYGLFPFEAAISVFSVFLALMVLVVSGLNRVKQSEWIVERQAFVKSLERARESGKTWEKAAILRNKVEYNEELASKKFWSEYFPVFHLDRIEEMEPIQ